MLILLPPSEGKTAPLNGPRLDWAGLKYPGLTEARKLVARALMATSELEQAGKILGVGPRLAHEIERHLTLEEQPCAPAHEIYTGVLYEAAQLGQVDPARVEAVIIFSGLFGAISPTCKIPAYRLPIGASLPATATTDATGPLTTYWKKHLPRYLEPHTRENLVVDCRSGPYANTWKSPTNTVTVSAATQVGGKLKVISHHAKHWRGKLTHHLLTSGAPQPASALELRDVAAQIPGVLAAVIDPPSNKNQGHKLTLIVEGSSK